MESEQSKPDASATVQLKLAEQACQGDSQAFQALFDLHEVAIRRFIQLRIDAQLQRRMSTSDMVQETFMEAHRRLADFVERKPMPVHVWLLKTAREKICDARMKHLGRQRRAAEREIALPGRSTMILAEQIAKQSSPSEQAMKRERRETVAKLLNQLNDRDQEILVMRHLEGMNYSEIADVLEFSASTARKRYGRALVRLQELCSRTGIESEFE